MLSVGAVALAGLVVVQAWQSGERARAAEGQNVPVIGRVFNDLYAGGLDVTSEGGPNVLDPQAPGVPNTGVELWQESGQDDGEATLLDTVITDADGRYRFTLPEYPASYLVRVRPTQIDGVNAMQTSFWSLTEGDSEVSGFCWNRYFGDYFQWSEAEFECAGARRDGIDPPEVTTPLGPIVEDEWGDQSQTGNANTLARIEAESSDLVELNFSLTASASWGDLPDEYGTTQAAGGPYAQGALRWYYNPYHDAALQLGWLSVLSGDGIPRADAKSHRYADDGIEFALKEWRHESRADGSTDTVEVPDNELTWYPAQDAVFTNNTDYRVRATINAHCDFLPKATVKLWASTIDRNTGEASGRLTARPIWQAAPAFHCSASEKATRQSVERVVYGDLNLSHIDGWQDVDPDGGFTDLYLRARIGIDSGFTAYSPGEPNDPYTEPWVMPGEIEDYRAHLAKTVAYVRNILPNGIRAAIAYEYTGMREDLDFYLPFDGGVFSAPDQYGNLDPAVATVVGVGAPGADSTNGWHVSGAGYHDYGALYCWHHGGDGGGALVDGDSITFGGYSPTVVCDAYYGAPLDPALSNMTISPAPDQALPVQDATRGSYSIKIRGRGTVPDIGGGTVEAPAVGAELTVVVEPVGGNASDYLLCLARDSYWQDCATSHEVYLDQDGQAELWLRAWDAGTYRVTAYLAGSDGPVFSSQDVYFAGHTSADDVAGGEFTIDTSTPKYADYGLLPGAVGFDGTWDYYTAQLVAWDNQGQGVMGLEGPGGVIANGCGSAVAVTPVDGQPGHYEARIYSNSAAEALCLLAAGGVMFTDSATGATSQTLTWLPLTVADPSKSSVRVEQRGEVPIAGWVDEGNPGDAEWLRVELRDANWSLLDGHSGDADELWRWSENNPSALHYARATDAYCANQSYCRVFVYSSSPGHFVPRVVINPDTAEEATLTADRPVFFGFSEPDPGSSSAVASRTPGQQANLASRPAGAAGKQTVTVRLRDAQGFTAFGADWFDWGVKIELAATGAEYGDGADPFGGEGLDWGEFECVGVTDLAYGALWDYCPTGVYTVDVYSSWAGDRKVAVTVSGSWDEPGGQPGYEFVLANGENRATSVLSLPFVPPTEPSAADSRLQVSPANLAGEVLTVGRGESYTAAVTVMDAGGYNPIHDAYVYLWLEQEDSGDGEECLAAFPNGREGRVLRTSLTGKAQVTIKSADVTKCVLRAQLETEFGYDELPNSPQTLEWVDHSAPVFSPARSYYTVSSDAIYADGEDAGTVTLQLMGTDGQPWNGSSSIMGFGPTDSGLAVSWFTHTSSPGEFTAPVTGTEVGTYPVTVSVNDAVLTASGNGSAAFVAGPAAFGPDLTRWTSPEWRSIEADGVAEALLEVAVTDARGRPMAGETVEFDVLDERVRVGLSTGPGTFESRTGADGVARLTVKSSAREYFSTEVVAFVGADQVPGSTVIEFTNFDGPARLWADVIVSPSDPADSTEGVPTPVAPGESYQVGVTPFDGSENVRIGNLPVEFSLSGPDCTGTFVGADGDGKALATVTAEVGPDAGTALAEVTSATPGACVLTVAVTTVDDVRGSGRTLVWTPSLPTLDLAASQFTVSQTPVVVGGSDSGTVTATLVGTDGQPWAEAVTLAGSGPVGSGVTVGAFVPVDAVGVYTAQFSGTTAGDWAISLTANGDALSAASGPDGI
ncbi:MAG: hypothetical protein LBK95_10575, partial [Bifidobacteriaceae bacterium]|nr:hypothetical protein [Bifidobacteriaceae bacterium]